MTETQTRVARWVVLAVLVVGGILVLGTARQRIASLESALQTAQETHGATVRVERIVLKSGDPKVQEILDEQHERKTREAKQELQNARIRKELESVVREGVSVKGKERELVITVIDKVLFDVAKIVPREEGLPVLNRVADVLQRYPKRLVAVEGHTDSLHTHSPRFESNWELSALRSCAVARQLIAQGVSPDRLMAVGRGDTGPVASNETEEGRAKNRRVEIVLYPEQAIRRVEGVPSPAEKAPVGNDAATKGGNGARAEGAGPGSGAPVVPEEPGRGAAASVPADQ